MNAIAISQELLRQKQSMVFLRGLDAEELHAIT
jgi:hypothetical protein